MGTGTVVMTNRKRMVLKPLSAAVTSQCREENPNGSFGERVRIQPPAALTSPTEKKRILIQESVPPLTSPVQRNKVLLSYSMTNNSDTDDSDDSLVDDDVSSKNTQTTDRKLYYRLIGFLCWVAVQYWMVAVAGFGAVFFACSALITIYLNTNSTKKRKNILSAYSVFNPQCTSIQGSADPKQLERELILGGL